MDDASCFLVIRRGPKTSECEKNVSLVPTVTGCDVTNCATTLHGLMALIGKRTRNLPTKKPSVRSSSLTDADINFFEKGNTDLCELQQNNWALLPKPLVVDSGAGETVMPVDWLTSHPLTESDGSRANDFHTTADGSKVFLIGWLHT